MQHPRTGRSEGDAVTKSVGGTAESNDLLAHMQVRNVLARVLQDSALAAMRYSPCNAIRLAVLADEFRRGPA